MHVRGEPYRKHHLHIHHQVTPVFLQTLCHLFLLPYRNADFRVTAPHRVSMLLISQWPVVLYNRQQIQHYYRRAICQDVQQDV